MKTDDFDFDLPRELVAQAPAEPRDASRLLVVSQTLSDHRFADLPDLLRDGDVLVVNDTRVIPARLRGKRGEASVEITLHMRKEPDIWDAFARPARKLRVEDRIIWSDDFYADVIAKGDGGEVTVRFSGIPTDKGLEQYGIMPLPPYIQRPKTGDSADREDYQTIYAAKSGAVAAPTAGLHYTDDLMNRLAAKNVRVEKLTLHVGAGTFLPVKVDQVKDHKMHAEWGSISEETANRINAARAAGGRIIAAGTTPLRLLESAADEGGTLHPFEGTTDIFITPGYQFRIVDILQTNFHLPRSTLFMLVSAFSGLEKMRAAYAHAIESGYRFYSYGDSCLLYRMETD